MAHAFDAGSQKFGKIFSRPNFFVVPVYQRPFSWDKDHFEDLVDDLVSADWENEYFLGTMVLHENEGPDIYDIVDGQQRITSIAILFACLRDLIQCNDFKQDLQEKIMQKKNVVEGIPERVRI